MIEDNLHKPIIIRSYSTVAQSGSNYKLSHVGVIFFYSFCSALRPILQTGAVLWHPLVVSTAVTRAFAMWPLKVRRLTGGTCL